MSKHRKDAKTVITAEEFHADKAGKAGVAWQLVFDGSSDPVLRKITYDGRVITRIDDGPPTLKSLALARAIAEMERQVGLL